MTATLTAYADETIPNKLIVRGKTKGPDAIAVEPASLGHGANEASAIPSWRAKQSSDQSLVLSGLFCNTGGKTLRLFGG